MEIDVRNVCYGNLNNVSFKIINNKVNCFFCDELNETIYKLLTEDVDYDGTVYINDEICQKIFLVSYADYELGFKYKSINTEFVSFLEDANYSKNDIPKRIRESLKIVGLEDKRGKFISDLSFGEKILLKFAMAISCQFKILVLGDIWDYLDENAKGMIKSVIEMLKNKYNKTIIIFTSDIDYAYTFVDHYIIIDKSKLIIEGDKNIFYDNYDLLAEDCIPQIVNFSKLVYDKKGIKFHVRNNVKDLIKDIYRSV